MAASFTVSSFAGPAMVSWAAVPVSLEVSAGASAEVSAGASVAAGAAVAVSVTVFVAHALKDTASMVHSKTGMYFLIIIPFYNITTSVILSSVIL